MQSTDVLDLKKKHTSPFLSSLKESFIIIKKALLQNIRVDRYSIVFLILYCIFIVPTIFYGIQNPKLSDLIANDEPTIIMELEGMTTKPYGNPANYLDPARMSTHKLPTYWYDFSFYGFPYYGGLYLNIAFIFFAPLKMFGFHTFPTAPFILRVISCLFGLLSLLSLYNFGKKYFGLLPAIIASILLFNDPGFIYYATIIHPDTLLFCLSFLSLSVAMIHIESNRYSTLMASAGMIGLAQGAKMAGLWFLPMMLVTIILALIKHGDFNRKQLVKCFSFSAAAALFYFALSTPYAFLDKYYLNKIIGIYQLTQTNVQLHAKPIVFLDWLNAFRTSYGNEVALLFLSGLIWALVKSIINPKANYPTIVAVTLALACFLSYTILGHYWVVIPYLVPSIAIAGFFIGIVLQDIFHFFHKRIGFIGFCLGLACIIGTIWLLTISRQQWFGSYYRWKSRINLDLTPAVAMGVWAQKNIDHKSMILYDGNAYFDPDIFHNQFMGSAVLRYRQLFQYRPDYIQMADWRITDNWIAKKMLSQHLVDKCSPDDYSARLYQDLITNNSNLDKLGPTPVKHIDLVHVEGQVLLTYLFRIDPKFYKENHC